MTTKPVIGISAYGLNELTAESELYEKHYVLPEQYVTAVRRAGGSPVLLPPGEESFETWLEVVDAIIISGGTDLDPAFYGGDPSHPHLQPFDRERDQTELAMTQAVLDADIPVLFVCRGMQVLNVAFGGTIQAHLADVHREDIHRGGDGLWTTHEVEITSSSLLSEAMGTTIATPFSGHHQGIAQLGDGLKVVALAPDGVVEAIEVRGSSWAVAVQWHPEMSAATDPTQQAIFDSLVVAARG
ncbi:MAG: gamma-glutamyl-gamma-aminobutyrate hydrolase family protein [Acidimicrobiales bacterium]